MLVEAVGPLAPEETWERYTHASRWSSWAPQVRGVSGAGDPVAPGERGWVRGPFPLRVPFTVLALDATALTWTWQVGVGPAAVVMDHGVESSGTGSRAWVDIHLPTPLVLPYAPIARLALRRLVRPAT